MHGTSADLAFAMGKGIQLDTSPHSLQPRTLHLLTTSFELRWESSLLNAIILITRNPFSFFSGRFLEPAGLESQKAERVAASP